MLFKKDHVKRMYDQAVGYIDDSNLLSEMEYTNSDAPSLLKIIAFEILIKSALAISFPDDTFFNHDYLTLWKKLPSNVKNRVLSIAEERYSGHVNYEKLDIYLNSWRKVYNKSRYYYELYEDKTQEEVVQIGQDWADKGMPIEEAEICYYPVELNGLIKGLSDYIQEQLHE